jgi:hypothetical protein
MVWEVRHCRFTPNDEVGRPADPNDLIVARDVLDPSVIKFLVTNALPETPAQRMLLVAFSRWRVELCFEDQKGGGGA